VICIVALEDPAHLADVEAARSSLGPLLAAEKPVAIVPSELEFALPGAVGSVLAVHCLGLIHAVTSAEATIGARLTRRACEGNSGNPQGVGNERVWSRQIAEDAIGLGLGHVPHFGRPARKMDRLI